MGAAQEPQVAPSGSAPSASASASVPQPTQPTQPPPATTTATTTAPSTTSRLLAASQQQQPPPPPATTAFPQSIPLPYHHQQHHQHHQHHQQPPPPQQQQQQPQPHHPHPDVSQFRPLNVRDALSYLDQVKLRFGDQPDVYNRFLDIMKEFKSQAIDTPGVIDRVSSLFAGHPNLIVGFNTFLPPGYKIESTNNPADPVRVTMPIHPHPQHPHQHHPILLQQRRDPPAYFPPSQSFASAPSAAPTLPPLSSITSGPPPSSSALQQDLQLPLSSASLHHHQILQQQHLHQHHPHHPPGPGAPPPIGSYPPPPPKPAIPHGISSHDLGHPSSAALPYNHPQRYPPMAQHLQQQQPQQPSQALPRQQQQQQQQPSQSQPSHGHSQHLSAHPSAPPPPPPPPPQPPAFHQQQGPHHQTPAQQHQPAHAAITQQQQQQQQAASQPPSSQSADSQPQQPPAESGASRTRGPVEFNHAINYVNKIKNRFVSDPETYKQFLEILQTYQKDQKPIQDVYAQVQVLFSGAPDLLDEFKQFLPDNTSNSAEQQLSGQSVQAQAAQHAMHAQQAAGAKPPPSGKKQAKRTTSAAGAGQSLTQGAATAASAAYPMTYSVPPGQAPPPKKKARISTASAAPQPSMAGIGHHLGAGPAGPADMMGNGAVGINQLDGIAPSSVSSVSAAAAAAAAATAVASVSAIPSGFGPTPKTTSDELEFFEKCKRAIGNKSSYNEFLKILNLFSQEIIEAKALIERVEPFLSRAPELLDWFKKFVKYEEDDVIYNIPAERPEIDLHICRRSGHSYRKLPRDVPRPICSGRDELAKEVLNDDWISHPVYVSETGFVSHKKTPYEEAMYKCEEERYEFDLTIEANLHVIQMLEPIARQIYSMPAEDRSKFRLPPGLNGVSTALYHRVIKKVYDRDRGAEVIEALHQNPSVAVPVVLKRLKQKDEEWKRSQRDWNKVWRELDAKNFAKALDHQGIHFKASDRKAINTKSLVTEIEILQREQREKRCALDNRYQFDFAFKKLEIFNHVRRLLIHFVEGNMSISAVDEERIRDFLGEFVKKFFMIEDLVGYDDDHDDFLGSVDDVGGSNRGGGQEGGNVVDVAADADGQANPATRGSSAPPDVNMVPAASNDNADMVDNAKQNKAADVNSMDVDTPPQPPASTTEATVPTTTHVDTQAGDRVPEANIRKRSSYTLYANTSIYAFFRLYQMLFSRLLKMKELSDELDNTPTRSDLCNSVAVELGLQKESSTPGMVHDRYVELLKNIVLFISNEMDATEFEDRARVMFWTSGYLVFTIDRLIQAVVKQMQLIVTDTKAMDLIQLYYRDRGKLTTSSRQEAIHRLTAETMTHDENVYRVEFFVPERVMTVQLLCRDDGVGEDSISSEERWSLYVDQFVQLSGGGGGGTGVDGVGSRLPFLHHPYFHSAGGGGVGVGRQQPPVSVELQQGAGHQQQQHLQQQPHQGSLDLPRYHEPFLTRNLPKTVPEHPPVNVETRSGLELKICVNTYKIFFVDNTEDYFRRHRGGVGVGNCVSDTRRSDKFRRWLDGETSGWRKGMTGEQADERVKIFDAWTRGQGGQGDGFVESFVPVLARVPGPVVYTGDAVGAASAASVQGDTDVMMVTVAGASGVSKAASPVKTATASSLATLASSVKQDSVSATLTAAPVALTKPKTTLVSVSPTAKSAGQAVVSVSSTKVAAGFSPTRVATQLVENAATGTKAASPTRSLATGTKASSPVPVATAAVASSTSATHDSTTTTTATTTKTTTTTTAMDTSIETRDGGVNLPTDPMEVSDMSGADFDALIELM